MRKSRVGKMEGLGTVTRGAIAIMRTGDPVLHVHSLRNRDTNVARPYCRRERGKALSSLSNLKVNLNLKLQSLWKSVAATMAHKRQYCGGGCGGGQVE